ncbi:MAG: homoserine dehydrogenase, partial [Eubacterium sp.]|nr:homoserine dehydrogenase [Eubacterium sp.]
VLVHDFNTIVDDPEVDIVVETMGGLHPAYDFTKAALEAGKTVCTSNKAVVAEFGNELLETAKANGVSYLFEASCGGGIPIIRPLCTSLTGDVIEEVTGILNGTTNYILTKMADDGSSFEDALKEAQANGFAEANPEADIEGHDACRKIAILSSLAYGHFVDFKEVQTEGITKITSDDIKYAKAIGASIKLLATSRRTTDGIYAMVSPKMVAPSDPLFSVNGVFNAIFVRGNMLGDSMFYGSGAGKLPTASAVVGDVVDAAKHLHQTLDMTWRPEKLELLGLGDVTNRFFVRVNGSAEEKLSAIRAIYGDVEVVTVPELSGEFAILTAPMKEAAFAAAAEKTEGFISFIRLNF